MTFFICVYIVVRRLWAVHLYLKQVLRRHILVVGFVLERDAIYQYCPLDSKLLDEFFERCLLCDHAVLAFTGWQHQLCKCCLIPGVCVFCVCVMQLERKKMVSEYKALREKEEEQRRLGEMEKSKVEAEEKRILSAELTARYRDRVWHILSNTCGVKFYSYFGIKDHFLLHPTWSFSRECHPKVWFVPNFWVVRSLSDANQRNKSVSLSYLHAPSDYWESRHSSDAIVHCCPVVTSTTSTLWVKKGATLSMAITVSILDPFAKSFTAVKSSKFPTKSIWGYPPHLKYVAALPWKT